MSLPDKCPFCSDPKAKTDNDGDNHYRCGSWTSMQRGSSQSNRCKGFELARIADRLAARVAELERDLEQAKADRNRAAMDARNPLMAQLAALEARCKRLEDVLNNVELVMQRPASNHRLMQIAEPARRVLNIIKRVREYKQ